MWPFKKKKQDAESLRKLSESCHAILVAEKRRKVMQYLVDEAKQGSLHKFVHEDDLTSEHIGQLIHEGFGVQRKGFMVLITWGSAK